MNKNLRSIVAVILVLSLMLIALTGCGGEKVAELDMEKVKTNLENLKGEGFDIYTAEDEVRNSGIANFDMLETLYDFDFKEFGINPDNISEYRFNMDKLNKDLWIVFLPVEGMKETVKNETDAYIQKLISDETDAAIKEKLENYSFEEIDGYLVWVVSEDNSRILEITRNARANVLPMLMDIKSDMLQDSIGLDPASVTEFVIKTPALITTATTCIVVKPADGKKDEVKTVLDNYMVSLEEQWSTYLPAQYELVKNRMYKEYGDYLIYIVSENNDLVYDTIISSTK